MFAPVIGYDQLGVQKNKRENYIRTRHLLYKFRYTCHIKVIISKTE